MGVPNKFSPSQLTISIGDSILVTNKDQAGIPHTWTSTTAAWDSGNLDVGQSFLYRFQSAGTFNFLCSYHQAMTGTVTVG
jgi:plastocyanin